MKEILKKLENNFNLMERNESPLKLNCLNLSGIKNSFSLKSILNSKIKKKNNSNSSRETKLNASFTKNTKKKEKPKSLIKLMKKYCPVKNLEYEIEKIEQKKKYAPNKIYEEKIKPSLDLFYREKKENLYKSCLKKKKYDSKSLVCKGKFRESTLFERKINLKKKNKSVCQLKNRNSILKKINYILNDAKEEKENLDKDIFNAYQYEKDLKKKKKKHQNKSFSLTKIIKEFNFNDCDSDSIDQEKILKKNYDKVKVCLDYKCKKYLRSIYNQINYEDNKLNKCTNISHFSIRNHYIIKQLKKDFSLVSKETIQLKKKYKGIYAVEPENENDFWNRFAKNCICNNIKDSYYLEQLIQKKNILRLIKPSFVSQHKF